MSELYVGWLIEGWRRKGVGLAVVDGHMLEVTGCSEEDIEQVAEFIKKHKKEIIAYLVDGDGGQPRKDRLDEALLEQIPSVCESCPRLELVDREDEVMAGCLYKSATAPYRFGWRRLLVGRTGCIWT